MAEQQNEPDFDNMSLEELRNLANAEASGETAQARDEQGRFVAGKPAEAQAEGEGEGEGGQETVVYRREIDLGDGAGKEVFEAPTMEELLDKIVEAKAHATRKIREQQAKLREVEQTREQNNADDEFVLSQELMSNPTAAIKKAFKQITGVDISEFKTVAERSQALEAAQAQQQETQRQEEASAGFMQAHPEYIANAANGKRLVREVNALIGEAKASGRDVDYASVLEQAYSSLVTDGMLQLKSGDAQEQPAQATPAATATPTRTPRRASSLASRAPVTNQSRTAEPSEEDLYSMPLDQLRDLANRQMRG